MNIWSVISLLITLFIAIAAWRTISTTRKSTQAHVALEISKELRSEESVGTLRNIIYYDEAEKLKNSLKEKGNEEKLDKVERVINRLSMLGGLLSKNIVDSELAIRNIGGATALRCWYQLHPYIKETQKDRGFFAEDFEDFARRSLDYFREANIKVRLRIGTGLEIEDLINELQKPDFRPRTLDEINQERNPLQKDKESPEGSNTSKK